MTMKTSFRIETDAFAFDNSWSIDGWELNEIRRYLAREHDGVVRALANSGVAHLLVRAIHDHHLIDDWMADEHVTKYGLCGGIAFAALDYYNQGWVIPQGAGPHDHPQHNQSAGRALRNYIWQRLLDSMQGRAAGTMLLWSLTLRYVPSWGAAWVLAQTKQEWAVLKGRLDAGEPWPIGLVGLVHGSSANHQVLAVDYDDPEDGTGTIAVYDSCCPCSAHTIALDFRGQSLVADESCAASGGDTQWKGFFCDVYTPARPPVAVGLSGDLTAAAAPSGDAGDGVTVRYTAQNYSFSRCPALALGVRRRAAGDADRAHEDTGEGKRQPLESGARRTLDMSIKRDGAGTERFSACCYLGAMDGMEVWKDIPAPDADITDSVLVRPD